MAQETDAPLQLTMFTPLSQRILDRLEQTDTNSLTPLQALNLLEELKNEIPGDFVSLMTLRQAAGQVLVVGLEGTAADRARSLPGCGCCSPAE